MCIRDSFWGISIAMIVVTLLASALVSSEVGLLVAVGVVLYIASFVVTLAASVKRWHDRNKSGAWFFISFIPIIGGLWALIEQGFLDGSHGENRYGSRSSGSPFG